MSAADPVPGQDLARESTRPPAAGGAWRDDDGRLVAALVLLHVVVWTLYGIVALSAGPLHDDMIEAWVWGQELRLGYFKHPPFYAWVTWAWFQLFPRTDWAFYLLAASNAGLGLWGTAALAGVTGLQRWRAVPVLLLIMTPLYGFMALKYNANAALIPLWPWTCYAFIRALESGRLIHGLAVGALAAMAMMTKYFSALLLVTFLAIALLPANRQRVFRTPAPYAAIFTFAVLIAPHVIWSIQTGFPSVAYAASKFKYPIGQLWAWAAMTALAPFIYFALPVVVAAAILGVKRRHFLTRLGDLAEGLQHRPLALLAALPFTLTLMFGVFGHAKVSLSYTIPILFGLSILIARAVVPLLDAATMRRLVLAAVAFEVGVALISPAIGYYRISWNVEGATAPNRALALEATRLWRQETGRPLRIVAGHSGHVSAVSFYSPDHPSHFINFRRENAPWITDRRIAREGMLIICEGQHDVCQGRMEKWIDARTRRVEVSLSTQAYGVTAPPRRYILFLVPPAESRSRATLDGAQRRFNQLASAPAAPARSASRD